MFGDAMTSESGRKDSRTPRRFATIEALGRYSYFNGQCPPRPPARCGWYCRDVPSQGRRKRKNRLEVPDSRVTKMRSAEAVLELVRVAQFRVGRRAADSKI